MARVQGHHITYEPEWVVDLTNQMHRCISRIQNTRATPEQYARLINFQHAISFEANRMRCELDLGQDCRILLTKPKEKKKGVKKKKIKRERKMIKKIKRKRIS